MTENPTLALLVIRVTDIERSAAFYTALGLTFTEEQHGKGAVHYSTQMGSTVFELYPASETFPVTTTRLGFSVMSIEAVLKRWHEAAYDIHKNSYQHQRKEKRIVVTDPDGHRIELMQPLH